MPDEPQALPGDNLTAISYKIVHEDFTPPAELVGGGPAGVQSDRRSRDGEGSLEPVPAREGLRARALSAQRPLRSSGRFRTSAPSCPRRRTSRPSSSRTSTSWSSRARRRPGWRPRPCPPPAGPPRCCRRSPSRSSRRPSRGPRAASGRNRESPLPNRSPRRPRPPCAPASAPGSGLALVPSRLVRDGSLGDPGGNGQAHGPGS